MLFRRAGLVFLLSGFFMYAIYTLTRAMMLLLVVFQQSSYSFWPFAHMSSITAMEDEDVQPKPTFDIAFVVNVLACSLPFSTVLIIGIFSFSEFFINPLLPVNIGVGVLAVAYIPYVLKMIKSNQIKREYPLQSSLELAEEETQKLEPRAEVHAR